MQWTIFVRQCKTNNTKESKFTLRMSDNVRRSIKDKANELERSEAWIVLKALEAYLSGAAPTKGNSTPPKQKKPVKQAKNTPQDKPLSRAAMIQAYTRNNRA